MRRLKNICWGLGVFIASSFSLHAGDLEIHFGICEEGSNCERCIDSFKYTLIPDFSSRRVVAIGFDKGGKAVWREYKGAKWKIRRIGDVRDFTVTMFLENQTLIWKAILVLTILNVG